MNQAERRRYRRVTLRQPIRGAIGDARVYLVDGSLGGIRIVHQSPLPAPGAYCRVEVMSDLGAVKLDCEVVRTISEHALYQTGLAIIASDHQSHERLRTIFA